MKIIRVKLWVPIVEKELPILSEHLSSPQVFGGVRVARFLERNNL
jgi:hypothetical protein